MAQATLSSKGQITIPKKIREKMNLHAGDKVSFKENENGDTVIVSKKKSIKRLAGILHRPGQKKVTIEEMNEAIKQRAVERYKRSL